MASLLDPISDRVRGNVILLGEVGGADVVLQHLPHDPSALLRGEGGSTDGAAEKKKRFKDRTPLGVAIGQLECAAVMLEVSSQAPVFEVLRHARSVSVCQVSNEVLGSCHHRCLRHLD